MNKFQEKLENTLASPPFMRKLNGWLAIGWVGMIPISYELHWLSSITYVSAISIWALVAGHWSTWQAARVECKQEEEMKRKAEEDIPEDVATKVVEKINE